jgi:hypothetical protein
LDEEFYALMRDAFNPDPTSSLIFSFDQQGERSDDGGFGPQHTGLPPAYFQCYGMDMSRDDQLIYERVLREEFGIPTRLNLYPELPHGWWSTVPELESSKKRMVDTVSGMEWLLGFSKGRSECKLYSFSGLLTRRRKGRGKPFLLLASGFWLLASGTDSEGAFVLNLIRLTVMQKSSRSISLLTPTPSQ